MAHKVTIITPKLEIQRADIEFEVMYKKSKVGDLKVSKGAIEWVTDNKSQHRKLKWGEFDEFMRKNVEPKS